MGTHDSETLKSEADILARQSRPQRNSTWVPKTRDWRYATGVIQHEDFQDEPRSRTVWDNMDYDYQAGVGQGSGRSRSGSGYGSDLGLSAATDRPSPDEKITTYSTDSPKSTIIVPSPKARYRPMLLVRGAWMQVITYKRNGFEKTDFERTGLKLRLRFTGKRKQQAQEILERAAAPPLLASPHTPVQSPGTHQTPTLKLRSPNTPATARTAETLRTHHMLDSIKSLHTFPLFKRTWVDETHDFSVVTTRSTLRDGNVKVEQLGTNYAWYADAVPIDAIFPPGVLLSAKEINAYYPHHVRWRDVMLRLTNNDYRGADIIGMQVCRAMRVVSKATTNKLQAHFRGSSPYHLTASQMNNFQRDVVKGTISHFKTTTFKGKAEPNLRTDLFSPGNHIASTRKGFVLPTFDDLVRGLQHLPSGLDARSLTHCLSWYLSYRDSFTPRLELNVLHAQSLIRALRQPLKPFGPQNLDRNALQEWRDKGTFDELKIEDIKRAEMVQPPENKPRTQLRLHIDQDDVSMQLTLPIRHVLTFPFLTLHSVVEEALKLGIEKAELRQGKTGHDAEQGLEARWADKLTAEYDSDSAGEAENSAEQAVPSVEAEQEPKYTAPLHKRPHPVEQTPDYSSLPSMKKARTTSTSLQSSPGLPIPAGPRIPTDPRSDRATSTNSHLPPPLMGGSHLSRAWNTPPSSSAYVPPQNPQNSVYGRRDVPPRQPDVPRGPNTSTAERYHQAGPYQQAGSNHQTGPHPQAGSSHQAGPYPQAGSNHRAESYPQAGSYHQAGPYQQSRTYHGSESNLQAGLYDQRGAYYQGGALDRRDGAHGRGGMYDRGDAYDRGGMYDRSDAYDRRGGYDRRGPSSQGQSSPQGGSSNYPGTWREHPGAYGR